MKSIETEIVIDAPVEVVWRVLMDFESYQRWNPFLTISGEPKLGAKLNLSIDMKSKTKKFKPTIVELVNQKRFAWTGKLLVKGLFAGNHYFDLHPVSEFQTKFVHGENFTGVLKGAILKSIGEATRQGFEQMNEAMKTYAEDQVI
mgnify:CR=1 FL=1